MLYENNKQGVLLDLENRFIYQVMVYIKYKNVFSLVKNKFYYTYSEINNIIECFHINEYISIYCDLHAAPKEWLINNGFTPYIKRPKNVRKKKSIN